MTIKTDLQLIRLEAKINAAIDKIHDEYLRKLRTLARSTGQRTRMR